MKEKSIQDNSDPLDSYIPGRHLSATPALELMPRNRVVAAQELLNILSSQLHREACCCIKYLLLSHTFIFYLWTLLEVPPLLASEFCGFRPHEVFGVKSPATLDIGHFMTLNKCWAKWKLKKLLRYHFPWFRNRSVKHLYGEVNTTHEWILHQKAIWWCRILSLLG